VDHAATGTSPLPSLFPFIPSRQNQFADIVVMDLAITMLVAAIMIVVAFKLKQPMVIGYIFAGMIIGPYTPPFTLVSSLETINLLAELGIIMLHL
jgi:CPA2 family monovalent cation:H+ antiporter-2